MKVFIKLRNKYFTALASLILLFMASIGLFNISSSPSSVDASMVKFDSEKTVTITNGSFTGFSSSSAYPYTLNNYTTSGNSTPSMKTGAINISDSVYEKNYSKYGLDEYSNPKGTGNDNYVLMINTEEDSDYTYTSKEFTLSANGYYYVTVSAKTIGDNTVASVFLMQDGKIFEDCIIQNITSTGWTNYTFFVATNAYDSVKLQFGMQIGSQTTRASGCVLFDELHAGQISYENFTNCLQNFNPNTYRFAEFRTPNAYKQYNFDNNVINFVDENGKLIKDEHDNVIGNITSANYFATNTSGGGAKTVDINNGVMNITTDDTYVIYKGEEEVLQPNSVYRFAIDVKASAISSGSAFVKLDEIIDDEDVYDDFMGSTTDNITAKSSNLTITSATSNTMTNGYVEYVIYVNTGALSTSKVQFSFGIGSETANATGNVSFKRYTIERVPYSAFSGATSGSTVGKINISDRISLSSKEYDNYTFDKMQTNSFDGVPYPATPSSWTKSSNEVGYQLSGVVNLSEFKNVMSKYDNLINTINTPASLTSSLNNNVLMIYNGTKSTQSYSSTAKTLTANKYYKITTFVNTHMWDADADGVTIVAKTSNTVLGKVTGVKTAGEWQRVELYINTPANDVGVTLELALGYNNQLSSGYAFFDNILVEEAETAEDFSNRYSQFTLAGSVNLDLSNPMLTLGAKDSNYYIPALYIGENKNGTTVNAGVIDLTSDLKAIIADSKMDALRSLSGDNRKVLSIATSLDVDSYYTYTSAIKYNFDSGKYYKLSFEVFTDGISQEDKKDKYDNGKLAEGVNISLTGLENAKFSYVTSAGEWTTYEFYIGVNSSATSNLVFSLGSDFTGCYGRAFLGNINLVEVDETEFSATTVSDRVLKIDTVEQAEDEETEENKTKENNFSWVYIPTIATFLAIVIAVVGVFVRRNIKFKKRVGNKKVEYDRDITVMQNKYRRLASDRRTKEIRELTKECDELIALRGEYEEKYKDALTRLRGAKLSNRDGSKQHEIVAIEREVKHISKEVARFGVQVNNYENEIEFMQTEAYLVDLEKRMMREDEYSRNQVRKEAEMPEEKRLQVIAKREQKQARAQEKAELKAEKLERKQEKLAQEREAVQAQLAEAKAKDEQFVKEQELLKIKVEEAKLAKEKAKAEKELKKLEKEKAEQELEKKQLEDELAKVKQIRDNNTQPTLQEQNNNTEEAEPDTSIETSQEVIENDESDLVEQTNTTEDVNSPVEDSVVNQQVEQPTEPINSDLVDATETTSTNIQADNTSPSEEGDTNN